MNYWKVKQRNSKFMPSIKDNFKSLNKFNHENEGV